MKKRFRNTAVGLLGILFLIGCTSLEKMKKNAHLIQFKVTPEVLETHAGKVDVGISGNFPPKYFIKNATMLVTPVLSYAEGEYPLPVINLQGEKINANNKVIGYNTGGNFKYSQNFAFQDQMRKSDLILKIKAQKGKKSVDFEPVTVGKGILATSTLMANIPRSLIGIRREANNTGVYDPSIDPFQRVVPEEMVADIMYLINSSELRKEEKKSTDVQSYINYTKGVAGDNKKEVKKVEVIAYASPDGSLDLNADLASEREKVSTKFLEGEISETKILEKLRTKYMPEDWEGFKQLMEKSNIQDKDLILRVLAMYTDPNVREKQIRNLTETFTQIKDEILPKLRRAKLYTSVERIGKSDEELLALAESNPGSLNQAELLYAATLTVDPARQLKIYNSFSQIFPTDWRGPNNAGFVLAQQFKYSEAKPYFEKAEKLKSTEPIVKNNLGTVALAENNIGQAEEYFGIAAGLGKDVNYNLGLVNIRKGDYSKATQYFEGLIDPNTALVKVITGNYPGALRDLESFQRPNCYMKEYLKAIIGARTNDDKLFFESLKKAMEYNPEWKAKARTEMQFAKYFENTDFQAITK
jgi:Flp pilus assembly protein TadD